MSTFTLRVLKKSILMIAETIVILFGRGLKSIFIKFHNFSPDEALDLFYIALMVFCADKTVRRGETVDAWTRDIEIYMPVLKPEKWEELKDTLKKLLIFSRAIDGICILEKEPIHNTRLIIRRESFIIESPYLR